MKDAGKYEASSADKVPFVLEFLHIAIDNIFVLVTLVKQVKLHGDGHFNFKVRKPHTHQLCIKLPETAGKKGESVTNLRVNTNTIYSALFLYFIVE